MKARWGAGTLAMLVLTWAGLVLALVNVFPAAVRP